MPRRPKLRRPDSEAVPIREAAARLGVSRGWAARLCREGRFPVRAFRIGWAWHVDRAELERYLRCEEERGEGGPEAAAQVEGELPGEAP